MNESNRPQAGDDLGSYVVQEGRPAVRFARTYPHSIERVWSAVTEPEQLKQWFPFHTVIEPRVGGVVAFSGNPHPPDFTGRVLEYEPPRRLAFSWGGSELRFELEALDTGRCRLILTDLLEAQDTAARNGAGWSMCLRELDTLLAGGATSGLHTTASPSWQEYYDAYVAAGISHGAAIPGRAE
ncbi:SRPBCC family protein [Actinospica sp.]|jgi:uncharacterized protein YndB with AHSA1/START domain|uniref:SRPBCC family protein n=1 Tax=Actinospica sp. TaxID=1872142 RepID=UPI002D196FD3|nr:SRPBCC family protein [Actinospica sp.]HWG24068.1 SRPBCC family protein [Actinospica sp.]